MADRRLRHVTNLDNEFIGDYYSIDNFDEKSKNCMEILIAESIGKITKNYLPEYRRLAAFSYYPPLKPEQIRKLTIENITSNDVQMGITDSVYARLELILKRKTPNWNPTDQRTAKRFVANAVQEAVEAIRKKLNECIALENQTPNIIVQRFVLDNNRLKIV
ncbi:unnamed protein product [Rotaria magnacalcarata]|uniref:Uncharacterized protein n=2 Tax=Rotaria magnacalcarata TaxID=392030 RepID=A0A816M722_9BILA|nr:unnamed protein product [Rotaria magnacalcarata]CAF1246402.1 unnamed protein product [Rotaria magnacalcarata]CAF1913980.1 unnamed protein product [Rotaria magnacalcarata]CAF1936933.1 unnamed protein product [Rotaria magnacalcarata]CAF1976821.1 unnamed protein product [Rotaria magnacalcarata]